jgi:hypothetical protein
VRTNGNGHAKLTVDQWAVVINTQWRLTVPAIIKTGELLIASKKALGHGKWGAMLGAGPMVPGKLDFDARIAQMLMKIANDPVLSNPKNFSDLPPVYTTLYQLTALPPDKLQQLIDDNRVNPRLKGAEAKTLCDGNILPEEFCKNLRALVHFLARCGDEIDVEMLDRMGGEFIRYLGHEFPTPAHVKEWLMPRLGALLERMQQHFDECCVDPDKIERDGKVTFAKAREVADPFADAGMSDEEDADA